MSVPLDTNFFTKKNFDLLKGAIQYTGLTTEDQKVVDDFKNKSIPMWPKSYGGVKGLNEQLLAVSKTSPMAAGDAEQVYQDVIKVMIINGYDTAPYLRNKAGSHPPAVNMIAASGYKEVNGRIVASVDVVKFKREMGAVIAGINKEETIKAVIRQAAEQDFGMLMVELLNHEESHALVGLLAARLLVNKAEREAIDLHLGGVTVLKNRAGKLSVGLVRLGGYFGLASVKDEPRLVSALRFIKNPILGEDVVDRPLLRRSGEEDVDYEKRKVKHEKQWVVYQSIMKQMMSHKKTYDELDVAIKNKLKVEVLAWTVG